MTISRLFEPNIIIIVIMSLIGCTQTDFSTNRSEAELIENGFYILKLPNAEVAQRGWSETIHISSFDRHCHGVGVAETANPIMVIYRDNQSRNVFSITLGPWNMAWDRQEPTTQIEIASEWASEEMAEYYEYERTIKAKFSDTFEIPVQVFYSQPSISETIKLINQLEYSGPPPETITNPWKCN